MSHLQLILVGIWVQMPISEHQLSPEEKLYQILEGILSVKVVGDGI